MMSGIEAEEQDETGLETEEQHETGLETEEQHETGLEAEEHHETGLEVDNNVDHHNDDNHSEAGSQASSSGGSSVHMILEDSYKIVEEPSSFSPTSTARASPIPNNASPSRSATNSPVPPRSSTKSIIGGPDPIDDVTQLKALAQRKNLIYLGIPALINVPSTPIKETTRGVFHIYNPTSSTVSWSLTPTSSVFYKRSERSNTLGSKVTDEIFVVTKQRGFLKPGQSERVDINFTPTQIGVYAQKFSLAETETSGTRGTPTSGDAEAVVELQIEALANPPAPLRKETKKKEVHFDVLSEKELKIPPTRVGRQRTLGIKIENPTKETIRIRCKCDVVGTTLHGPPVLSIPISITTMKPESTIALPISFHPRKPGVINAVVTLGSPMSKTEVKIDVTAHGVPATWRGDVLSSGSPSRSVSVLGRSPLNESSSVGSSIMGDDDVTTVEDADSTKAAHNGTDLDSNSETHSLVNRKGKMVVRDDADCSKSVDFAKADMSETKSPTGTADNVQVDVSDISSNGSTDVTKVEEIHST